jgi:signal transduction histidine kinase
VSQRPLSPSTSSARRGGSLRTQLIAWNIAALAVLLGTLGVVVRYTVSSFLMASVNRELERMERLPPPPFRDRGRGGGPPFGDFRGGPGPRRFRPPRGVETLRPRHFDLQGQPLNPRDTRRPWDDNGAAFAAARQGREHRARIVVDGEPLLVLSVPIVQRGQIIGVGQAAYPLTDVERTLASLDAALLALIPVALLGAWAGGAFLTERVLGRVRQATQAAERIGVNETSDFAARLPVTGNDEFSRLAETFNNLLGRLETAFRQQQRLLEQQRRFAADASHELKTPLTVIKDTASMALASSSNGDSSGHHQRSFRDINRAADAMSHLVGDLLLLARSDGGQLGRNPISLPGTTFWSRPSPPCPP